MGHDFGQSLIVIALHPNDLDAALGVRQLSNVRQEIPVLALEPPEVQVREDVAKQDETAIGSRLQDGKSISRTAEFGPEMQVRKNQRVIPPAMHAQILVERCYLGVNRV